MPKVKQSFLKIFIQEKKVLKRSGSSGLKMYTRLKFEDHLVALRPILTPAEQRVPLGASVASQQHVETILGPDEQ